MSTAKLALKSKVVSLILSEDTEKALDLLNQHCRIAKPKLKVGMPKRHSKKLACHAMKNPTICVSRRETHHNPHVILHEFYHHLRNSKDAQMGVEKYADKFAENYLQAYRKIATHNAPSKS
ncbi:MAG: hypothetical protein ACE5L6_02990 [Candidatus Bathyarchaeia archaeon]